MSRLQQFDPQKWIFLFFEVGSNRNKQLIQFNL